MASDKPLVLVIGATGLTGKSIVQGLLKSGNFRIAALVRPASLAKPGTEELKALGVEIRPGDVGDDYEKLKKAVDGVNILISSIYGLAVDQQRDIFRAAKEVGVQRVIPCDFATPGAKGVRALHDLKLDIHEFIKDLGLGYTFIDVGWWMQVYLPLPSRSAVPEAVKGWTHSIWGREDALTLVTNLDHIGTFVAKIIADPRTLNRAVIVWEDEVTQLAAHEIGERASGEGEALKAKRVWVPAERIRQTQAEGKALLEKDPTAFAGLIKQTLSDYHLSIFVLQENTLENAKKLGYLDARELYPDVPVQSLEDFAKKWYSLPEPGFAYDRFSSLTL